MLVKKINSEWYPKEKQDIKIGETIDITDPKQLILNGDVVAIDEKTGAEISAFELYGVVVDKEFEEFKKYQQLKSQERQAEKLKKEQEELQQKIKEKIAEDVKSGVTTNTVKTAVETITNGEAKTVTELNEKKEIKFDELSWKELTSIGTQKGIYKVGMKKDALVLALKNEK